MSRPRKAKRKAGGVWSLPKTTLASSMRAYQSFRAAGSRVGRPRCSTLKFTAFSYLFRAPGTRHFSGGATVRLNLAAEAEDFSSGIDRIGSAVERATWCARHLTSEWRSITLPLQNITIG